MTTDSLPARASKLTAAYAVVVALGALAVFGTAWLEGIHDDRAAQCFIVIAWMMAFGWAASLIRAYRSRRG